MNAYTADRNLLTGILGLQTGLYSQSQLIQAMQTWVFHKDRNIEAILVEQHALEPAQRDFLAQLVEQYLRVSKADPQAALSKLPAQASLANSLRSIEDPDLTSSIINLRSKTTPNSEKEQRVVDLDETKTHDRNPPVDDARYKVLRPHAKGGLGKVSVAEDKQLHREVALKQIQEKFANDEESRVRFLVEAEVTGQLEHPGIVPVYSLGFSESGPYYAMRFIRGESLKQAIESLYQQKPQIPPRDFLLAIRKLVKRLIDAGNALDYAHSRGVLHRDVKPGNIMLGKYGETLLVDWGLAKSGAYRDEKSKDEPTVVPLSGDSSTETRMGSVFGTISYMSPEQARGRLDLLGPWSDVYSLGATLYSILTGQLPLSGSTEELLAKVQSGEIIPVCEVNPLAPKAIQAICQKAMAIKIEDRYKTVHEFIDDLELWLADEPISIYQEPFIERLLRTCRRHKTAVSVSAAVTIAVIAGSILLHFVTQYQNAQLKIARDAESEARSTAENNLKRVQKLSLVLLNSAEDKLSAPAFTTNAVALQLRRELTEQATTTLEEVLPQSPNDPLVLKDFAQVLRKSANFKRLERDFVTARTRIDKSIEIQEGTPDDERTPTQRDLLAETYRDLATLEKAEGKYSTAIEVLSKSETLVNKNLSESPNSIPFKRTLATSQLETISLLDDTGKSDEALAYAKKVAQAFRSFSDSPEVTEQDMFLKLFAEARIVQILGKLKRFEEAESNASTFIERAKPLVDAAANDSNLLIPYCRILFWSAENLMNSNTKLEIAEARFNEALSRIEPLAKQAKIASIMNCHMDAQLYKGMWLLKQGRLAEADQILNSAATVSAQLVARSASHGYLYQNSRINFELGKTKQALNDIPAAKQHLDVAKAAMSKAAQDVPVVVDYPRILKDIDAALAQLPPIPANSPTR